MNPARKAHGARIYARLRAVFAVLAKTMIKGRPFDDITPWWATTLERLLLSGARRGVFRVGRRGRKSMTLLVLAVVFGVWGDFVFPLGDTISIVILSAFRDQAVDRLNSLETILRAIGVDFTRSGDTITLARRPVCFRVLTASVGGVVGATVGFAFVDELAFWECGREQALEIIDHLSAAMISQRHAVMVLPSAPLSTLDAHYACYAQGESEYQVVATAATWVANPSVSKEETIASQPRHRAWLHLYAAEIVAAVAAVIGDEERADAYRVREFQTMGRAVKLIDASKARDGAEFASCFASWGITREESPILMLDVKDAAGNVMPKALVARDESGRAIANPAAQRPKPVLVISDVEGLPGGFADRAGADEVAELHARQCRDRGVREIWGDQFESFALEAAYRRAGASIGWPITFSSVTWGNTNKTAAVERLRKLFLSRSIQIPKDERLDRQLAAFTETITAAGNTRFAASEGEDDRAMLLVLACAIPLQQSMPLSPLRQSNALVQSGGGWGNATGRQVRGGYR